MGYNKLKRLIIKLSPSKLIRFDQESDKNDFNKIDPFESISYSQEGEDLILKRIFEGKMNGFYVDVGAHHPKRFSNTYLFYKIGWRGINIDAMPRSMEEFERVRPEDINIQAAISDKNENLEYYQFNEPALNTLSIEKAREKDGYRGFKIIQTSQIETIRLDHLLDSNNVVIEIDFINIDVEGYELKVLKSNNWYKYRPKVLVIESTNIILEDLNENAIYRYLKDKEYQFFAKSFNTLFFVHTDYKTLLRRNNKKE